MKYLVINVAVLLLLASCSGTREGNKKSREEYMSLIDSMETKRMEFFDKNILPPKKQVLESVQALEFFVADYPDDEDAPKWLFEAAKRYETDLQDYNNAIRLYQKIYDDYEGFEHHEMALFHIGNAYHSAKNFDMAKTKFSEFVEKYPEHDFADDAEGMIKIIEMGGEEEFLKRILDKANSDTIQS